MLDLVDSKARQAESFREDVIAGLSAPRKTLPSRWLYDDLGCDLFEQITRLDEYYPTRTETTILRKNAGEIADFCGSRAGLIEYGAGAGIKTEILLGALHAPDRYLPVDIAGDFLATTADRIGFRFPDISVRPIVADFTGDFNVAHQLLGCGNRVGFFPGSTMGNLDASAANDFLRRVRRHVGTNGKAIIGIDLKKDIRTLIAAYDDRDGVTARFNLNLLTRINRELNGAFIQDHFAHEARWNDQASAIEMHLVSRGRQRVCVGGRSFEFADGETIHTESSRKYDVAAFARTVESQGWTMSDVWSDDDNLFGVFGLRAAPLRSGVGAPARRAATWRANV
jgi:L-histidine Nalpha-methyltransferase